MLNQVQILGLFGMYNYTINLLQSSKKGLLFMTGPNGMGKSTVLRIINALYNKDFTTLCQIEYTSVIFTFDSCIISIHRDEIVEMVDSNSDVPHDNRIELHYHYHSENEENLTYDESCSWIYSNGSLKKSNEEQASINSLDLLMASEKCLYVADSRLSQNNTDEPIYKSEHLQQFIENLKVRLSDAMIPIGAVETDMFKNLEKRAINVSKQLQDLALCGIDFPSQQDALKSGIKELVWHACRCCEHAFQMYSDEIQKLQVFREFLENSHLVDKELEISLRRGYRFISKSPKRTILTFDMLSSGERHLIMQIMMLLISPQKISLVLIDEPEISFHLMWQMQYLEHITKIQDIRKCSILVATHSTQIFDSKFELTTDLWRQHKNESKHK